MKILYISIIAISLLSITFVLPSVQGITGSVLFMKTNSTAKIYADYTFRVSSNETWTLSPEIFTGLPSPISQAKGITIVASPSSFTGNANHTKVVFTVTTKPDTKGVYALFLFFCGLSPLSVGLNESEVDPVTLKEFFTATYNCPMENASTPDLNIVGYSGMVSKLITVNANNTITAYPQNMSSPNNAYQPPIPQPPVALNQSQHLPPTPPTLHIPVYPSPLEQFKTGTAANRIQCNDGLQLVIKSADGSPACVMQKDVDKLIERGWTKENASDSYDIKNSTSDHEITFGSIKYDTIPFQPDLKQTVDLDGVSFTYTGNGTFTQGDCYGTWINQTEAKSFTIKGGNEFGKDAYQCWPPYDYPSQMTENGKPVHILPSGYNYSFFDINQTAGVAWCSMHTCSLGKALYLVKQGWNLPETYDLPSLVQFYFSTNSSVIHVGQTIGADMGDNNTQLRPIRLPFSHGYSFRASSLFPCDYGPYRIAVFEGDVTMEDLNNTEPLHFYQPGDYLCQVPEPGKFWIFEPLSNTATLVCHLGMNCNDTRSNRHLSFNGYWDDKAHFHLLEKGNYTIFASDEWRHMAIKHFTVTNSTASNELQTSQIVPQCVSNIPHPYAIAGPPGFPLCPVAGFQASGQIVNSTGFYGIYNYTKFPDTQNFVLEPGHNATITYKISVGSIHSWASTTPSNAINLTNYVTLMHYAGMHDHPGVYVSVYPTSETIPQNGSAIVTVTLSASKDASYGTYWMQLPPGICFGGEEIILTVTDCTGKK